MGDTATSVNQGGASGSTGLQEGGKQMRAAAAEARRILVAMAADKLGVPAEQLSVNAGVVHSNTEMAKSVSYADLIGGRYFNVHLDWNGKYGNPLYAPGKAQPKDPKTHAIVGQPIKRQDVAPKVFAQQDFCTDVKVPGMVHGRMIRPAVAGAVPVKVDENSIKDIPGAKVVWNQGFLGVVADKEWDAIRASRELKVEWSDAKPPFPNQASLYDHIRKTQARKRRSRRQASRQCRRRVQDGGACHRSRIRMAVSVARQYGTGLLLVDIKDGHVTCWSGSAENAFHAGGHCRDLTGAGRQCSRDLDARSRLVRP